MDTIQQLIDESIINQHVLYRSTRGDSQLVHSSPTNGPLLTANVDHSLLFIIKLFKAYWRRRKPYTIVI